MRRVRLPAAGRHLIFLACVGFFSAIPQGHAACTTSGIDFSARLKQVQDGDSIILETGERVRLIGLNAPEQDEPFSQSAKRELLRLVKNGRLRLQVGKEKRDRYGRLLAHVFNSKGQNVTELMLRGGYGAYALFVANNHNAGCYVAAEREARNAKRGLWDLSFYEFLDAAASRLRLGFIRIEGDVEKVVHHRAGSEIHFRNSRAHLFVPVRLLPAVGGKERLAGVRKIGARGWLARRGKKEYSMRINHRLMIEYIN